MALTEYPKSTWETARVTCGVCGKVERRSPGVLLCLDCFSWARDVGVVVRFDEESWKFRWESGDVNRPPAESAANHG